MHRATLIPGDGVGPEVISAATSCIEASGVELEWEVVEIGQRAVEKGRQPLPREAIESIKRTRVALKGPVTTPVAGGFASVNVALRKALGLYAGVRPCKLLPGLPSPFKKVDLVVIRENTEDLYAGIEWAPGEAGWEKVAGTARISGRPALALKSISRAASIRIASFAFEYARKNKRKSVTIGHKANILKKTDGLFLSAARKVAKNYRIRSDDRLVDNLALQLVTNPQELDVLLLPNLYGDILSDLCAGLVGGVGVVPGANIGDRHAIFEPVHGSAPKYAGKNKVNPAAAILSGALLLEHLGEQEAAGRVRRAVASVIKEGRHLTYDIARRKPVGTKEMAAAIVKRIKKL